MNVKLSFCPSFILHLHFKVFFNRYTGAYRAGYGAFEISLINCPTVSPALSVHYSVHPFPSSSAPDPAPTVTFNPPQQTHPDTLTK